MGCCNSEVCSNWREDEGEEQEERELTLKVLKWDRPLQSFLEIENMLSENSTEGAMKE